MKQRQMTIVAVACGVVCAACVALFMASVQGEADSARAEALARYGGEQVEVYVAARDIVAGERVDLSAVETKLWVADLLPDNAVQDTSDVVGKTVTSSIFKGEVITQKRFDADHGMLDIPAGKQAVSVPAKAVQAVGGAIQAGMSIDVYSSGDSATTALASNVSVLDSSVGSSGSLSGDNGWITLAVDPDKVQEIIAASNKTTLYFTLPGESAPIEPAAESGKSTPVESRVESGDSASSASAAEPDESAVNSKTDTEDEDGDE